MSWFGNKVKKFRQVPEPYFSMHITAKFLAGLGLGVLLATWLSWWAGILIIAIAVVIAIPSARIVLSK